MRQAVVLLLLLLLRLAAAATARAEGPPVAVRITSPTGSQPAYDVVTVSAVVAAGEPISSVAFSVDGRTFAEVRSPPFEATTDVGPDNVEHRFAVVATTVSGATGEGRVTTPSITSDLEVRVELQQLYVAVREGGERVTTLGRDDFEVLDDGERQQIVTFARGDIPFTAVVLIDASASMRGRPLEAALSGAGAFFAGMNPLDEGKLVVFSDHVIHETPFAGVAEVLLAGLGGVRAGGGTALNDVLFASLDLLEERQGRRVAVLLSDGVDVHSALSMASVADAARQGRAMVYWIRRGGEGGACGNVAFPTTASFRSPWYSAEEHRDAFRRLERTVRDSGGAIVGICSLEEAPAVFADILAELREQYAIGYYPSRSRHDGSWHRLKVRVRRAGLEVTTRAGYVDR